MNRPTIRDVARASKLSEAAVSFALNGKPGVSEATRERVRAVARELGWGPHAAAQALSGSRAGAVGLVIARPYRAVGHDSFFLQLIAGLEAVLTGNSLALVLQIVGSPEDELAVYRRWWSEHRVDGVVLVDLREEDARPQLLQDLRLPAVLAGGPHPTGLVPSVSVDDAAAMQLVVEHLLECGHRRVAHVPGLTRLSHTRRRMEAFAQAAAAGGLRVVKSEPTDYTEESGRESTAILLRGTTVPDAIIYDNEVLALGGLTSIYMEGLRVPDDIAVVSWEDSPVCRVVTPTLTALSRDATLLGEQAARLLLEVIEGGHPHDSAQPLPVLVKRESTRARDRTIQAPVLVP